MEGIKEYNYIWQVLSILEGNDRTSILYKSQFRRTLLERIHLPKKYSEGCLKQVLLEDHAEGDRGHGQVLQYLHSSLTLSTT